MDLERSRPIPWDTDTTYALAFYRTLGRGLGFWPIESNNLSAYTRITFVAVTQLWMSVSLSRQLLAKGNCGAVTDIVDVLSLITCGVLTSMKVIVPKIYQSNMRVIVESAIEDWSRVQDEKSRRIMLHYAQLGRAVFIVQMLGGYAAGFPLIFARLPFVAALWADENNSTLLRDVPIGPSCWISPDMLTYQYVSYFVFQSVQLFVVCTGYIGGDTYFFGIAMHVCGQYKLLYANLERTFDVKTPQKHRIQLSLFIQRHKHLLQLADHFEQTYNLIILAQVAADTILTCISGIVLLIVLPGGDFVIIAGLVIRIYLVYIQLFMYSYVGEQFNDQVKRVRAEIYCKTPWYDMSPSIVRDMAFIIMRSNREFYLTAGKMYNMNLENYKNIVKAMGSYFSILRLMFITEAAN